MNDFVFQNNTKVYFGKNQLQHIGDELKRYGSRVLIIYGGGSIKKIGLYDKLMEYIKAEWLQVAELSGVEPNPRHTTVNKGADICRKNTLMCYWLWKAAPPLTAPRLFQPPPFMTEIAGTWLQARLLSRGHCLW